MNNDQRIIVVAGATGQLGKLVCEALLSRARAAGVPLLVRGLTRKSGSNAKAPMPAKGGEEQQLVIEPVDYDSDADLKRVCVGVYAVVSAMQGHADVMVDAQSRLLRAAIQEGVRRFIPSDFSLDFTKLPAGSNRNFDVRLAFHDAARRIVEEEKATIEITRIFQGAFTELLASGWMLVDYKKHRIGYFGSADTVMEFTTWKDTAEYTAAAALDANPTPSALHIAGARSTPRQLQVTAARVTGTDFGLKRLMPLGMLAVVIKLMKVFKPGKKDETMPMWVGMQYAYCMAVGTASPDHLDNDRYEDIRWTGPDEVIRGAFEAQGNPP